jgi:hypothetical protein
MLFFQSVKKSLVLAEEKYNLNERNAQLYTFRCPNIVFLYGKAGKIVFCTTSVVSLIFTSSHIFLLMYNMPTDFGRGVVEFQESVNRFSAF